MFRRDFVEAAIARLEAQADTPIDRLLASFLKDHVEEVLAYDPEPVMVPEGDETLLIVRRWRAERAAEGEES